MEFNLIQGLYRTLLAGSCLGSIGTFIAALYSLIDGEYLRGTLFFGISLLLLLVLMSLLK